jgi:hypothetical protein
MINAPTLQSLFTEIELLRLEIEKLQVQNLAQRSIILTIYRLLGSEDSVSKNALDGNLRELLLLTRHIDQSHPIMKIVIEEVQVFLAEGGTPTKANLKIIQGGMDG